MAAVGKVSTVTPTTPAAAVPCSMCRRVNAVVVMSPSEGAIRRGVHGLLAGTVGRGHGLACAVLMALVPVTADRGDSVRLALCAALTRGTHAPNVRRRVRRSCLEARGYAVSSVAAQADGKVLIGGRFTSYNGTGRNAVARLNTNGTLDTTFNPGTGATHRELSTAPLYSVVVQADGKVLIGGLFTDVNGIGRNNNARLNADGTLDTTFNPGSGANDQVNSVALQADGKVLIGGLLTAYNGTGRGRIARVNDPGEAPGRPGRPAVVPGLRSLTVSVVPPTTGGAPTSYVATALATGSVTAGNGNTCSATPQSPSCVITGLASGGRYQVSVVATGDGGSSPASFFRPRSPQSVTRADFVVFVWRMAGRPAAPSRCDYTDLAAIRASMRQAACWAKSTGVVTGARFRPNGLADRSFMAAVLWRFAGQPAAVRNCDYRDLASIPVGVRRAACWMKRTGIVSTARFNPTGTMNRAGVALQLYRTGGVMNLWVVQR